MKVSVEKLPSSEAVLTVDVSWDEVEKASDKAYKKLVQQVDVQGFRRGKAPRSLVERKIGKEYIYQEGLDTLISEAYRDAVRENDLSPITQPEMDAPVFEMGQPYHFTLTVPVLTPATLGDYKSLHFDREEATVTSEEVEHEIEEQRERKAEWKEVEHPAEYNDRVTVDLKLVSGDQTISDLKDNPFELTNERHGLFSGMDVNIVGLKAGEEKSFTTTIPEDYSNEKLAGKEATYTIKIHKVEHKDLPELNDDFAKEISELEDLEELRKAISDQILSNKKREQTNALREKVLDAVIEQSNLTIHPKLVDEEAEEMLHQLGHMLEPQHISLDQYLMMMRKSREEYLQEVRPEAEKRVKQQLILDALMKEEKIQVSPEEVEALYNAYAQMGQTLPRTDTQIRSLALSLLREKTISRLVDIVAGPDPEAEPEAQEAAEDGIANAEAAAIAIDAAVAEAEPTTNEKVETKTVPQE